MSEATAGERCICGPFQPPHNAECPFSSQQTRGASFAQGMTFGTARIVPDIADPLPAEPDAGDVEALAEALESLAPLVRQGLMGVNVPAGADLNPALCSTDPTVAAAKDEHVRRALSWVAHAHPNAVRTALDAVRRTSGADAGDASEPLEFIRRLVGAWDCCGTCAGGVLAQRDRAREAAAATRARAEAWDEGHRLTRPHSDLCEPTCPNPYRADPLAPDTAGENNNPRRQGDA